MNSASGVVITVNILPISLSSKNERISSNKLWIDFRKKIGGFVIKEMKMSVSTWTGFFDESYSSVTNLDFLDFFFGCPRICSFSESSFKRS